MAEKKIEANATQAKPKAVKKTPGQAEKPASKQAAAKKDTGGKTVTITQTGSPIGRQGIQRATLIGLGLNKLHRTCTLEDTPAVQGMIRKVKHLLEIKE